METSQVRGAHFSVGATLAIITGGLAIGMAMFAWVNLINASDKLDESRRLQFAYRLSDKVIEATGAHALERGIITGLLSSPSLASPDESKMITALRDNGDKALAEAFALADQLLALDVDNTPLARSLDSARSAFQAHVRARVHAYRSVTDGSRTMPALDWFQAATDDIEAATSVRLTAVLSRDTDGSGAFGLAANLHLKQMIWLASEYAGRERAMIAGAIGAGRPLDEEQRTTLASYRAIVDTSVASALHVKGLAPEPVRQSIERFEVEFLDKFERTRARVYAAGLGATGETASYPLSREDWVTESTRAINTLIEISNAISRDARAQLNATYRAQRKSKNTSFAFMAVAIILGALALMIVWRRVIRPLAVLRRSAERLGNGDFDERVALAGSDEIGRLAATFNAMAANIQDALVRAQAATKAKTEFLASMSHELRTPLNGVLGYAQLLLDDDALTGSQRDATETILRSGEHLLTLLNDLLDLSKIEAGRMELHEAEFPLQPFLDTILDMFRTQAQRKHIQLLYEPVSALPRVVRGDEQRLRQILINLVGNAVKFTDEGGVTVNVGRHRGALRFQVVDTGVGIAPGDLDVIFAPFEQASVSRDHAMGTGLGLAITRRLAAMMGSEIEVRSTPGEGSAFWFDVDLPEVAGWTAPDETPEPAIIGYHGPRRAVLLVDDKPDNLAVLSSMLTPLGFDISQARDGRAAVEQALASRPHLILMDIRMPVMSGLEATRQLREDGVDTVIIAVSASAFDDNRAQCLDAGCDAFITKPVRRDVLLNALQRHLALTWERSEPPGQPSPTDARSRIAPPPADVLAEIYDLAEQGDIGAVRARSDELAAPDSPYQSFGDELTALSKAFQLKRIREFLRSFMDDDEKQDRDE